MDLAGVEAGAKMFVPEADEPFGSVAHPAMTVQNSRRIVCAKNRNVENIVFNIDILLPFFTPETPAIAGIRLT
jgi:hypothetical protein